MVLKEEKTKHKYIFASIYSSKTRGHEAFFLNF